MRSEMIKHNKDLFESLDDTFALLALTSRSPTRSGGARVLATVVGVV